MKIFKVPGDGHCFFHAVGLQTGLSYQKLRTICSALILDSAETLFNGLKLKDWIFYETGLGPQKYAIQMSKNHWAGALEMKLLADYFQTKIAVYKKGLIFNRPSLKRITVVEPEANETCSKFGTIYLCYSEGHYDAIV